MVNSDQRHIVVLGAGQSLDTGVPLVSTDHNAGVVGLSTALRIAEQGYDVTIVAETFPTDSKTIRYTSHWAVGTFTQF